MYTIMPPPPATPNREYTVVSDYVVFIVIVVYDNVLIMFYLFMTMSVCL